MRGTLDINRESNIHAAARTMQTPISIHALHEESDTTANVMLRMLKFQSTLSMRRATYLGIDNSTTEKFQSTLSMRRATRPVYRPLFSHLFQSTLSMRRATPLAFRNPDSFHISIHALHEESDRDMRVTSGQTPISIHALHEESDTSGLPHMAESYPFQSTLSMRRATRHRPGSSHTWLISIHALHEESDNRHMARIHLTADFNPRSP